MKGQAAFEYLSTFAWVLIVVLATITALSYFGIMDPMQFLPQYYKVSGSFAAGEYKLVNDGIYLQILNIGDDLKNYSIKVIVEPGKSYTCDENNTYSNSTGMKTNDKSPIIKFCTNLNLQNNDRFKADIKVNYVNKGELISHSTTGRINARVEN